MATFVKASWADAGSSSDEDNHSDVDETPEVEVVPPAAPIVSREYAPRAAVELPSRGPFVAFVGNLAYGVDEDILGNFFVSLGCEVTKVNVHRDRETNKSKGFAHVEFGNRDSLAKALDVKEELKGRTIKVDVADRESHRGGSGRGRGGAGRGRGRDSREPTGDARRSGYEGRGSQRPPRENREYVQHDRRAPPKSAPATEAPEEAPKERPKLNLQPRSIPLEAVGQPVSIKPSIFGEGKPREENTAAVPAATPAVAETAAPVEEPVKKSSLIIESPRTETNVKDRKNRPKQPRDAHREVRVTNGKEGKEKKGPSRRRNPDTNAAAAATAAAVKANKKREEKTVGEDDFVTASTKKTGVAKKEAPASKPAASVVAKSSNMFAGLNSDDDSDA